MRNGLAFAAGCLLLVAVAAESVATVIDPERIDAFRCRTSSCGASLSAALTGLADVARAGGWLLLIPGVVALLAVVVWSAFLPGRHRAYLTVVRSLAALFGVVALIFIAGGSSGADASLLIPSLFASSIAIVFAVWLSRIRSLPSPEWTRATQSFREFALALVVAGPFFAPDQLPAGIGKIVTDVQGGAIGFLSIGVWLLVVGPGWTAQAEAERRAGFVRGGLDGARRIRLLPNALLLLAGADVFVFFFVLTIFDVEDSDLLVLLFVPMTVGAVLAAAGAHRLVDLPDSSWVDATEVARQIVALHVIGGAYLLLVNEAHATLAQDRRALAAIDAVTSPAIVFVVTGLVLLLAGKGVSAYRSGREQILRLESAQG